MSDATILLVCAVVALILAAVDIVRSRGQSLTAWGLAVFAGAYVVTSV